MKPMNSRRLNDVFDKLAKIGQKKVKKSESLFASINLQDEMIKIASKQIVLDPIEMKLRTGYVHVISKERPYMIKTGTQFTHLPDTKELKKEKKRTPSSAPSKYPSGSETTAPYVGEQHGGDQTPAASTLAKQASSKALKEVIRELKHEDQIFVDISQVIMRLNQKGQQTSVNFDDICKTLADNGITLIKKASDNGKHKIVKRTFEALNHPKESEERKKLNEDNKTSEYMTSYKYVVDTDGDSAGKTFKSKSEAQEWIEKHASLQVEAAAIGEIRERLNSARDSRSYHVDMLQEKDLEDNQKEKHQKSKKKWEKEINRLDREYAKAVRVQRKEERDESKREKAEKAEQEQREMVQVSGMQKKSILLDEEEVSNWIMNDEGLYNWAISEGVPEDEVGDTDSHAYNVFVRNNEKEIHDAIRRVTGSRKGISKKADIEGDGIAPSAEIAESFINGNITWVKEQIAGDINKFNEVLIELENTNPSSVESFRRTMTASVKGMSKKANNQYQAGDRVELVRHTDMYSKLTPGEQGTVNSIDDTGTVHIAWDSGETLGMVPDAGDEIKLISADASDVSASGDSSLVVTAEEPLTMEEPLAEPSFELENFLSPTEYQEMQRLLDLRHKAWHQIAEREERNLQEGLEPYANIDYSEVELYNDKIKQYQEVSKGRKEQNIMPDAPEADTPMSDMGIPDMPPIPEEGGEKGGEEMGDKGVLDKRPLPEFASAKDKMKKKAVTSQDIPHVCKNCKTLVIPSGYKMLSFLDHKVKPYCTISDGEKRIGFRYAYSRECRGYDAIMKEMTQKVDTPSEYIFEEMKDNGVKSVLERKAGMKRKANDDKWEYPHETGNDTVVNTFTDENGSTQKNIYTLPANWREIVTQDSGKDGKPSIHDIMTEKTGNQHGMKRKAEGESVEGYECPDCKSKSCRYLDCDECKAKGETCEEIICTDCGATAVPKKEGNQHGMKRKAEYEDNPKNEPATIDSKEDAEARGKKVCEKCMQYFIPRGQKHMTQDWHKLWDIPYTDVAHCEKGTCIPRSLAYQSKPDSGVNQFDTISNRVVEDKK